MRPLISFRIAWSRLPIEPTNSWCHQSTRLLSSGSNKRSRNAPLQFCGPRSLRGRSFHSYLAETSGKRTTIASNGPTLVGPQYRWQSTNDGPIQLKPETSEDLDDEAFWQTQTNRQPSISRAILYFIAFGTVAFSVAAYSSLRETDRIAKRIARASSDSSSSPRFKQYAEKCWGPGISEPEMIRVTQMLWIEEAWQGYEKLRDLDIPSAVKNQIAEMYKAVAVKVINLNIETKLVMPIIFVNSTLFLLWTISATKRGAGLRQFMRVNFTHRPSSGLTHTMFTSSFSHKAPWHFLFNNICLWSFGGSVLFYAALQQDIPGNIPESWPGNHFLAFFATAGVFAAMTSHIRNAILFKNIVQKYGMQVAKSFGGVAGLGSSGAIWAVIAMTACTHQDNQIGLIFLPFVAFPIKYGVAGLLAVDVVGLVKGWQTFDHVAHLGGAFFGFMYYQYGIRFWATVKQWVARAMAIGPYDPVRSRS